MGFADGSSMGRARQVAGGLATVEDSGDGCSGGDRCGGEKAWVLVKEVWASLAIGHGCQ